MKQRQQLPRARVHLVKHSGHWWWSGTCPICGDAHDFDAGPDSGPPIVALALSACERRPFIVEPACLDAPPCAGCPAVTSQN
jgi:hypothetical protein